MRMRRRRSPAIWRAVSCAVPPHVHMRHRPLSATSAITTNCAAGSVPLESVWCHRWRRRLEQSSHSRGFRHGHTDRSVACLCVWRRTHSTARAVAHRQPPMATGTRRLRLLLTPHASSSHRCSGRRAPRMPGPSVSPCRACSTSGISKATLCSSFLFSSSSLTPHLLSFTSSPSPHRITLNRYEAPYSAGLDSALPAAGWTSVSAPDFVRAARSAGQRADPPLSVQLHPST